MFKLLFKSAGSDNHADGVRHWWKQRLTAVAMIPLVIWFAVYAGIVVQGELVLNEYLVLTSKTSVIFFGILLIVALYHATLGIKVVIEDYVHNKPLEVALTIFINLFGYLTVILLFFSLLQVFFEI